MEFQVRGDDGGGEFGVGGGAGARAPYLRGDVVKLLAILETRRASDFLGLLVLSKIGFLSNLVGYYGPGSGSGICRYHNSSIEDTSDDSRTGACSFG